MKLEIPYFKAKEGGRYRWEPGPGLRAAGFRGRDLKDGAGGWLDLTQAAALAIELNAEVAAWRLAGAPRRTKRKERQQAMTATALWDQFVRSPAGLRLAHATQKDYANKANVFLATFGHEPVASISKPILYRWWEKLYADRGHAMANGILAVVRLLLSHAEKLGWITHNPAKSLRLIGVPPRCEVWSPSEIDAALASADALGLPSVGDAIVIALHTGQRQGDVLALEEAETAGGRVRFRIAKTAARVSVPQTPQLEQRLAGIRARVAARDVVRIDRARRVVLTEAGNPYKGDYFRKQFAQVRARAAKDVPSIAEKQFLDLRDTAITRLALAGCTVAEIRAITGHSLETVHSVLKHYLALDDRMAVAAIERLKTWMEEEGIAV